MMDYQTLAAQTEQQYGLPQGLLRAVLQTESAWQPDAVSPAGAQGIAQFMPGTAKDLGVDPFDPQQAIPAAGRYLAWLQEQTGGDLPSTLAAYNWGIGNVQRKGLDAMPAETQSYLQKVGSAMPQFAQQEPPGFGEQVANFFMPTAQASDLPEGWVVLDDEPASDLPEGWVVLDDAAGDPYAGIEPGTPEWERARAEAVQRRDLALDVGAIGEMDRDAQAARAQVGAGLTNLSQGLGLGTFNDEALAGTQALYDAATTGQSLADAYRSRFAGRQQEIKRAHEEMPITGTALKVAGTIPTAIVGGTALGMTRGAPLLSTMVRGGALGGAQGAAMSSGAAQPGSRLQEGAKGGAIGAALGAAVPAALSQQGGLIQQTARATGAGAAAGAGIGALVGDPDKRWQNAATGAVVGAGAGLIPAARQGIGEGMRRLFSTAATGVDEGAPLPTQGQPQGGVTGPGWARGTIDDIADRQLLQALERDRLTPDMIARNISDDVIGGTRPAGATIMDAAGRNTQSLGWAAQSVPGRGKAVAAETVGQRIAQRGARFADYADDLLTRRVDTDQLIDDVARARAQQAAPLYQQAYAHGEIDNPRINQILQMDIVRRHLNSAIDIAEGNGVTLPLRDVLDDAGNVVGQRLVPTVQALDYMKQSLDDAIDAGFRGDASIRRTLARTLSDRRNEMLRIIDAEVPAYAQARRVYTDQSSLIRAVEQGRDFFRMNSRDIASAIRTMSDAERDMFRRGAVDAIRFRADQKDSADMVRKFFDGPELRAKITAIAPRDQDRAAFNRVMEAERAMARTDNAVYGNSLTAERVQAAGDLDAIPGDLAQAATRGTRGIMDWIVAQGAKALPAREKIASSLADRLFQNDPAMQIQYLRQLEQLRQQIAASQQAAPALSGVAGTVPATVNRQ